MRKEAEPYSGARPFLSFDVYPDENARAWYMSEQDYNTKYAPKYINLNTTFQVVGRML